MVSVALTGILNITPDSFSDGGLYNTKELAIQHARALIEAGATVLDIGGDSTRPGSVCVEAEEEWNRIMPIIKEVATHAKISVDTHQPFVAEKAIEHGVSIINDVFAARVDGMLSVLAGTDCKLVLMYSCMENPHFFKSCPADQVLERMQMFFAERLETALSQGLKEHQLIIDTGMGGFLHKDAQVSWEVIRNYTKYEEYGFPLMFGSSRKGFLKSEFEVDIKERDPLSALSSYIALSNLSNSARVYVRSHEMLIHRQFLSQLPSVEFVQGLL